jgi:uncharacterized repeat protein (TIGR01451 family)
MKRTLLFALLISSFFTSFAQTPPVCGGLFTDPAGPNANYVSNSDYTVTIYPTSIGQQVTVTFTSFAVEAQWDALYVYNGDSTSATQIASTNPAANVPGGLAGGFWGAVNPGPFTSSHPSGALTFRFRSDNTITQAGWIASVTCAPPSTCPRPTALTATAVTTNSAVLAWTNNSPSTSWEVVALPCGTTPTATTTGITATTNPFTVPNLTPGVCYTLFVRAICSATSEVSNWSTGVTITTIPTCPSPTQLNVTSITTTSVVLGWTGTNTTNYQVIWFPCGTPAPTATSVGWLSTTVNPFVVTGLNPLTCYNFYVRAICNNGIDIGPWSTPATATTLAAPPVCGGNFTDLAGPNANYANNSDSTVTICPTNAGEIVTVTFTAFNVEANWDALYVFDGNSIAAPQIASTNAAANVPGGLAGGFWGSIIPGPFTSTDPSGCLTFRFRSDNTVVQAGWIANVSCSPPPTCPRPSALVTSAGTINSVTLGWTNNSSATSWEVVALPCGTSPTATTTGIIAPTNPFTITTGIAPGTCYTLFVRAICSGSDISLWSAGINFTSLSIPPVCGGNYIDNGGLNANYLNNSDSTVTICPIITGEVVTVSFTAFNVEATWDALYVYDGTLITSPQIVSTNPTGNVPGGVPGGYWGNTIPGPFTSSDPSGCLTFRFRSDTTVNNPGWTSTVSCGPAADKIQLVAFVDQNSNGIKDSNESLYANGSFVYQQNNTGPMTNAYSPTGRYDLLDSNPTNTYDFSYQLQPEYVSYYSSGTTTYNDVAIPIGSGTNVLYFPITLTQTYNDLTISIVPMSPPRPGLTYINRIVYRNIGLTAANGNITFTKPTPVAITNVSQSGAVITAAGYTYAFTNLLPNETRFFNVTMSVPFSPTVVLNDVLTASVTITAPANDINLTNNTSNSSQIVVNSFDPNDKMEAHGDEIPFNQFAQTDYLYYTIRFQNNGTANAINVRIQDVLDAKLDETSIRMISASNNYTMNRISNTLSWNFRNIQLVPSSVSQDLSRGYIYFKIRMKPGFVAGDLVSNNAAIFFDSNPAIVTNTFDTKFVTLLSTVDNALGNFIMYPNPASDIVTFSMENTIETIQSLSITDVLGKTVMTINDNSSNEINVDVSNLSKGVYLVEITTESNLKATKKLVVY